MGVHRYVGFRNFKWKLFEIFKTFLTFYSRFLKSGAYDESFSKAVILEFEGEIFQVLSQKKFWKFQEILKFKKVLLIPVVREAPF